MFRFIFLSCFMLSLSTTGALGQQTLLTPELLWTIGRLGLDDVSPDGRSAVYGVQRYDVPANKSTRTLYLVDLSTGKITPLTDPDGSATDAAFRPDGKAVGFLRDSKLCEVAVTGGPAGVVSDLEINGFHYAPDGKHVLFARNVKHDKPASETNTDLPKTTGRVIDGLFYRHWKSWHDYKYSNVFYAPYANGRLTGEPVNIMNEPYDSPLRPLGGMEQVTWSPDGTSIVYTCRKLRGTEEAQSTNADLYRYHLSTGKTDNLTPDLPGYDQDPVFSPDGRFLAWSSMERPGFEADRTRLMVLDLQTGKRRELTDKWIYEARHPQWSSDGKSLYFLSSTDFTYHLFEVPAAGGAIRRITQGQFDYNTFSVAGNSLVATRTAMNQPAELFAVDPASGEARQLTKVTTDPWSQIAQAKVERRTVKTTDGKDLNVWVILPPGFDPSKKYPALLYCQGGPQSALSQSFSYRWNFSLMASKGYVVIAPCRRGMPGAGQEWTDAVSNDWGGRPMQDLLAASDALAQEPWVDKNRMGAVGASFGGYSVYWLAGNHQKRFKAFVSHCGIYNLESFFGSTEELWFAKYDLGAPYWDPQAGETWKKDSPHRYVQNWDTPLLVIHNELDFRVPLSEGMQAFQASQLRGIPSKFLYFPDEGHWVAGAQNSLLWQRTFFDFLGQYLGEKP